ncbi:MAG: methylmalonyl Co-A mutase-associated GTPase MeaB [Candidatus Zixiibacteriota bacterium]
MAEGKSRKDSKKKPPSALHVVQGVEGGHDGMPGSESKAFRPARRNNNHLTTNEYVDGILAGDRTIIGRAITLIESNARQHQEQAQELLKEILPHSGNSIRVGITGVPGAGKSTFIEALGCQLTDAGNKVAVMAVDPSSSLTKGSILGDKTRMEQLSRDPNAFIRPSPSGGTLGGVARKTRETIIVFEAAGFNVVLVETIGVGQNEITVRSMVDFFLLILIAGAGDELQGIKRGVMEIADAIIINKADGDNIKAAKLARAEYERAIHYLQPATKGWNTGVHTASAIHGDGIKEIWDIITEYRAATKASGVFDERRREQSRLWLHSMLEERIKEMFYSQPDVVSALPKIERAVMDGSLPAAQAAWEILNLLDKS